MRIFRNALKLLAGSNPGDFELAFINEVIVAIPSLIHVVGIDSFELIKPGEAITTTQTDQMIQIEIENVLFTQWNVWWRPGRVQPFGMVFREWQDWKQNILHLLVPDAVH